MRKLSALLIVSLLSACANLPYFHNKQQLFEEKLNGEHIALADCTAKKLQSDGRPFMRFLQIRNRQYPDLGISEIHALDTRYLRSAYAAYAPSNPDGILFYGEPGVEVLSSSQRSGDYDEAIHAFALTLQKYDEKTTAATLKGDSFTGRIAWEILQHCATQQLAQ